MIYARKARNVLVHKISEVEGELRKEREGKRFLGPVICGM